MKNKYVILYNTLIYLFLAIFICFPLLIVFINTNKKYLVFSIFLVIIFLLFINCKKIKTLENKKTFYFILLLTVLTKIIYVIKINANIVQVSDFERVFNNASSMEFIKDKFYYQTAYHYLLYTYLNGILYKIFRVHQIFSLLLNSIVVSSVSIFIYKICYKIFKNRAIGNLSALVYMCWPSITLYTAILTPDHFSMLFIAISVYLLIILYEKIPMFNWKKDWIYLLLVGFNISMIGFFKNFAPILLLALLIILFLMCILNKKLIKTCIIICICIFGVYFSSNKVMFKIEENIIDAKIMENQLGRYVWVGLGLSNGGLYSDERYTTFDNYLIENNMNYKKTSKYFMEQLWKEFKNHYEEYPNLLKNKTITNFVGDYGQLSFLISSISNENIRNKVELNILTINNIFYTILLLFTLLASIYNVKYLKNNSLLYINITFFGSCLMLLLAESQNRYKYSLFPMLCILSSVGLYYSYDWVRKILKERN